MSDQLASLLTPAEAPARRRSSRRLEAWASPPVYTGVDSDLPDPDVGPDGDLDAGRHGNLACASLTPMWRPAWFSRISHRRGRRDRLHGSGRARSLTRVCTVSASGEARRLCLAKMSWASGGSQMVEDAPPTIQLRLGRSRQACAARLTFEFLATRMIMACRFAEAERSRLDPDAPNPPSKAPIRPSLYEPIKLDLPSAADRRCAPIVLETVVEDLVRASLGRSSRGRDHSRS